MQLVATLQLFVVIVQLVSSEQLVLVVQLVAVLQLVLFPKLVSAKDLAGYGPNPAGAEFNSRPPAILVTFLCDPR